MDINVLAQSILNSVQEGSATLPEFIICTLASLIIGVAVAFIYMYKSQYSKDFVVTLALLPAIVQVVIMMVNGNMGVGIAVLGAFSLVRFRSIPGSARDIAAIFLSMAVGLACGMGYIWIAALFVIIMALANAFFIKVGLGASSDGKRQLKVSIPETLDFETVFDDLFAKYLDHWDLEIVRTTNMGALYTLCYTIRMKQDTDHKAFMDELRQRNGNLEVSLGRGLFSNKDVL
ncbi:MAG: DUF4956 domain-containing protein [Coriobacteriales bacterium]|nr:DUF4956 domain-containing protein [Coriobacteriales bacterium]